MTERASDRWVGIALSVLLHGTLVAALAYGFWTYRQAHPTPTLAIEATVVDPHSVNPAALKAPAAPEPPAPAPPAPEPPPVQPEPVEPTGPPEPTPEELAQREQAQKDQARKEQEQKDQAERDAAEKQKAEHEAAEKQRRIEEQKQQEEAQRQAEEKRKQREAQEKERAESEAELKNSIAAEEHANQLRSSGALASWEAAIQARIQRAWLRPPSARSGIQCLIFITQSPAGQVLSAHIESCNGDAAVRESIEAAVYRASPLPAPPDPSLFERDLEIIFAPN